MLLRGGAPRLSPDSARAMTTGQPTRGRRHKAYGGLGPGFFTGRSWAFCQAVLEAGGCGWDGGLGTSRLVDPACDLSMASGPRRGPWSAPSARPTAR